MLASKPFKKKSFCDRSCILGKTTSMVIPKELQAKKPWHNRMDQEPDDMLQVFTEAVPHLAD